MNLYLFKVNVEKFRKNTNDILEKGSIAIEKIKTGNSYYLVYRYSNEFKI